MTTALLKIAGPYTDETLERVKDGFEKLLGRRLEFTVERDDTLIGGFVAYIDGRIYDSSVTLALDGLRRSFDGR